MLATFANDPPGPPFVGIAPTNPAIHYVGRWDTTGKAPRADWSASEVALRFKGTGVSAQFMGTHDEFQIVVDGKPAETLKLVKDQFNYTIAKDLPDAEHTVQLVKRTEAMVSYGGIQFLGFDLPPDAKPLPWTAKPDHRIEMIGDSITCGYGNEDTDKNHHFKPETENAYLTYGPLAARQFNAECHIIAWSGRKMFPNNTMPEIYGQTLATDGKTKWDFSTWTPDAVVINLATNDFGNQPKPDEKTWPEAYKKFITATLRKNYPKADIFICTSPMMAGPEQATLKKWLTAIQTDLAAAGDKKIHVLELATQDQKDGYGADWHPSLATHKKMAATLSKALETELGWKPETAKP